MFFGGGGDTAHKIREKMLEIVCSKTEISSLSKNAESEIYDLRKDFEIFKIKNFETERPLLTSNDNLKFYSFADSKINRTIKFLLKTEGIECTYDELESLFNLKIDSETFQAKIKNIFNKNNVNFALSIELDKNPEVLDFSKWGQYLPLKYQIELLKNNYSTLKVAMISFKT